MASLLTRLEIILIGFSLTWFWWWLGYNLMVSNKKLREDREREERMRFLTDNSEIYKALETLNTWQDEAYEKNTEPPIEAVQPDAEPSPADLVLFTVKENKW